MSNKGPYSKLSTVVLTTEVPDDTVSSQGSRTRLIEPSDNIDLENVDINNNLDINDPYPFGELEESPHGRHMGIFSTMVLYISRILGSGIFASSSIIFESCGRSPLLFTIAWLIAFLVAYSGLYVYLELGSLIPRSGGTKVFLEIIYNKPFMFTTVIFLMYSICFGFAILSPLIFGEYILRTFDIEVTEWKSRMIGLGFVISAAMFHALSVKHGVIVQNVMGFLKIMLLVLLLLTGIWVICFPTHLTGVPNQLSWDRFFQTPGTVSISSFSNAIIMANFTLAGWNMGHTSSNEVKDPVRTYRIAGPLALFLIILGYAGINACFITALTSDELATGGNLVGSILFEKIYGKHFGKRFLTFSIAVCTAGNIWVVVYSVSRMSQEVFREGFLPGSKLMASNKPFGTPLPAILLCVFLSTIIMLAAPEGGIYGYIVSIEGYPVQLYTFFSALGIFILRRRFPETKAPIRSSLLGTGVVVLVSFYLLITPFVGSKSPNPKGTESWISYALLACIFLFSFVIYWFIIFRLRPWLSGYDLVPEIEYLDDGLKVKTWTKVPSRYFG